MNFNSSLNIFNSSSPKTTASSVASQSGLYKIKSSQNFNNSHKQTFENVDDENVNALNASISSASSTNSSSSSSNNGSDEDVLHVVTNVYTIPIVKSTSSGDGPFVQQSVRETHSSKNQNDDLMKSRQSSSHFQSSSKATRSEPHAEMQSKLQSNESRKIVTHSSSSTKMDAASHTFNHANSNQNSNSTKSKFQIRSIVEIYESQSDDQKKHPNDEHSGTFKTSSKLNETIIKEIITDIPIQIKGNRTNTDKKYTSQQTA